MYLQKIQFLEDRSEYLEGKLEDAEKTKGTGKGGLKKKTLKK